MSKYGVGLRNAGSYISSGAPWISRQSLNKGEEVKIEFPSVTKNVTIKIPSPPNNAARQYSPNPRASWFTTEEALNNDPQLSSFGDDGSGTNQDWTLSWWMKAPSAAGASRPLSFFGRGGGYGHNGSIIVASNTSLTLEYTSQVGAESTTISGVPDISANWVHCCITQLGGDTILYVNGNASSTLTNSIRQSDDVRMGWNGGGYMVDDIYWDEMTFWLVGMNSEEVSQLYNSGEWYNPENHNKFSDLEVWWSFGDSTSDNLYNLPKHNGLVADVVANASEKNQKHLNLWRYDGTEEIYMLAGGFTSQTKGTLRTSMVRSLIGGINFPSVLGSADTTDNYLSVPQYGGAGYAVGAGGNDQTVSFWFKVPPSGVPTYATYFMRNSAGTAQNIKIQRRTCPLGDGSGAFIEADLGGASVQTPGSPTAAVLSILNDEWRNVIIVMDGTASKLRMYLDGELVGEGTMTGGASITNWRFPNDGGVVQNYGAISIWNAAFDDDEALELYNIGGATSPTSHSLSSDLKNYYNFDPSDGDTTTTIKDRVGSNDATITVRSGMSRNAEFTEGPNRNVVAGKHYRELQGYNEEIVLPIKTKEIYITAVDAQVTFEVVAELTNIPSGSMYTLSGAGIDD